MAVFLIYPSGREVYPPVAEVHAGDPGSLEELKNKMVELERESYLKDENMDPMVAGGIAEFIDLAGNLYNQCIEIGKEVASKTYTH